jgi:hypothetical protein
VHALIKACDGNDQLNNLAELVWAAPGRRVVSLRAVRSAKVDGITIARRGQATSAFLRLLPHPTIQNC